MLRIRVLLLALLVLAVAAASADASSGKHARFPKTKLTYKDKSVYKLAVKEAVRRWNLTGTPVRLRPARRGKRADITVTSHPHVFVGRVEHDGSGGGTDLRGRRLRGHVRLSLNLGDPAQVTARQMLVAVHEFGHALGLPHSLQQCTIMLAAGSPESRGCPAPPGQYLCGPLLSDAQALAKLYRGQARYNPVAGLCAIPEPKVEILTRPGDMTAGPGFNVATMTVRNGTSSTWKYNAVSATFTDAAGNQGPSCFDETPMFFGPDEEEVPPGGIATFNVQLCNGEPGTSRTYHLRLADGDSSPGKNLLFGPVVSFTVQYTG